jgi:guanine deaminase
MPDTLYRASLLHTPRNPFKGARLEAISDAGVAVQGGKIVAIGDFSSLRTEYPNLESRDLSITRRCG